MEAALGLLWPVKTRGSSIGSPCKVLLASDSMLRDARPALLQHGGTHQPHHRLKPTSQVSCQLHE